MNMGSPQSHRERSHVTGWWYVSSGRSRGQQSQQNNWKWVSGIPITSLNCHVSSIEDADKLLRSHELNVHCGQSWFVEPDLHSISKLLRIKAKAKTKPKASSCFVNAHWMAFCCLHSWSRTQCTTGCTGWQVDGCFSNFLIKRDDTFSTTKKYFSAHVLFRNLNWPIWVLVNEITTWNKINSQMNFARFCL